jgi:hypothetical protein
MNPQLVAHELSPRLPDNVILTADSGSSTNWWAQHLRLRQGMRASLSGNPATMGPGTPYAVGAKFAYPQLPMIAFVGDGAFQMNGMAEMITVKRYWERWSNPTLVVCVFNNQDLNQVTWEQRTMAGDPKFMVRSTSLTCRMPSSPSCWGRPLRRHPARSVVRLGRALRGELADLALPVDTLQRCHRVPEALAFPGNPHTAVLLRRVEAKNRPAKVRVELDPRAGFGCQPLHRPGSPRECGRARSGRCTCGGRAWNRPERFTAGWCRS